MTTSVQFIHFAVLHAEKKMCVAFNVHFVLLFNLMFQIYIYIYIYIFAVINILAGRKSEFLATDTEVPCSIPGATRFSE